MIVTCLVAIAINASGIPVIAETTLIGIVKKEGPTFYLADFSKDLDSKNYDLVSKDSKAYSNVMIEKNKCVND